MTDLYDDPEFRKWAQDVRVNLVPKLQESGVVMSIVPDGEPDAKFAVELGLMIMMDKPIVLIVTPGRTVPPKLAQVADLICEGDVMTAEGQQQLADSGLHDFLERYLPHEDS